MSFADLVNEALVTGAVSAQGSTLDPSLPDVGELTHKILQNVFGDPVVVRELQWELREQEPIIDLSYDEVVKVLGKTLLVLSGGEQGEDARENRAS